MAWGPVLKHFVFHCLYRLLIMFNFTISFYYSQLFCKKLQVAYALYSLTVPVHFHFGYYAQTSSKDFVK
jgi:hypothetical protein